MNPITAALDSLFNRIPRRHSADNVKEIYNILDEYEIILQEIESSNPFYEKAVAAYFDQLEQARAIVKKSTDNKAAKKVKDNFFDEASGILKDSVQELLALYGDGSKTI